MEFVPADEVRLGGATSNFSATWAASCGLLDVRQQDHELVTALATDRVGGAHTRGQAARNRLQHLVADRMPQRIVDVLETIQVQEEQRHLFAAPLRQPDRLRKPFGQQHPIGQAGEKSCCARWAIFSTMARDSLTSWKTITAPATRPSGCGSARRNPRSPTRPRRGGPVQAIRASPTVRFSPMARWAGFAAPWRVVPSMIREHLRQRPAQRLLARPAGHRLGDQIQIADVAREIGGQHRVTDGVEGHLGALLFLEQGFFRRLQHELIDLRSLMSSTVCTRPCVAPVTHRAALKRVQTTLPSGCRKRTSVWNGPEPRAASPATRRERAGDRPGESRGSSSCPASRRSSALISCDTRHWCRRTNPARRRRRCPAERHRSSPGSAPRCRAARPVFPVAPVPPVAPCGPGGPAGAEMQALSASVIRVTAVSFEYFMVIPLVWLTSTPHLMVRSPPELITFPSVSISVGRSGHRCYGRGSTAALHVLLQGGRQFCASPLARRLPLLCRRLCTPAHIALHITC
jgi:hypothetical protein